MTRHHTVRRARTLGTLVVIATSVVAGSGATASTGAAFPLTAVEYAAQPAPPAPSVRGAAPGPVVFTAAGDIGGSDDPAGVVLASMAGANADFLLMLGDLSYEEITPASAWCDWVKGYFPANHPIEIVVGNHEDDDRKDLLRNMTERKIRNESIV